MDEKETLMPYQQKVNIALEAANSYIQRYYLHKKDVQTEDTEDVEIMRSMRRAIDALMKELERPTAECRRRKEIMCEACDRLKNVQDDKKAKTVLQIIPSIDSKVDEVAMVLNHKEDGTPFAHLTHNLTIDSTERSYNTSVYIKYCPFCGRKLYKSN